MVISTSKKLQALAQFFHEGKNYAYKKNVRPVFWGDGEIAFKSGLDIVREMPMAQAKDVIYYMRYSYGESSK